MATGPGCTGADDGSPAVTHRLGLTLTGSHLTGWSREEGRWVARARRDLRDDLDVRDLHDEAALAELRVELPAQPSVAGTFGQLGLRDLRLVSHADGSPVRDDGDLWLSATSAGPGFFDSAHTSLWRLTPGTWDLRRTGDLFFRRPDHPGVYGDHATHVVRDDDRWLVATSTWGDFEQPTTRASRTAPVAAVTLASVDASVDLLHGEHVLDTAELPLPTDGLASVAVWDPHLVRDGERWLVGFVSASRFFRFHPALAGGASLPPSACSPRHRSGGPPRAPRCCGSTTSCWSWPATGGTGAGASGPATRCSAPTWSSAAPSTRRTPPTCRGRRWRGWTTAG